MDTPPPGAQGLRPPQTQDPSLTGDIFLFALQPPRARRHRKHNKTPATGARAWHHSQGPNPAAAAAKLFPFSSRLSSCLSSPLSSASNAGAGAAPSRNTSNAQVPTPRATSSQAPATPRPSRQEGAPQALPTDVTSQPFPTRKEKKKRKGKTG